jgi:hypothetical protein
MGRAQDKECSTSRINKKEGAHQKKKKKRGPLWHTR